MLTYNITNCGLLSFRHTRNVLTHEAKLLFLEHFFLQCGLLGFTSLDFSQLRSDRNVDISKTDNCRILEAS